MYESYKVYILHMLLENCCMAHYNEPHGRINKCPSETTAWRILDTIRDVVFVPAAFRVCWSDNPRDWCGEGEVAMTNPRCIDSINIHCVTVLQRLMALNSGQLSAAGGLQPMGRLLRQQKRFIILSQFQNDTASDPLYLRILFSSS